MRLLPSTLRWRLTLRYATAMALGFVVLGGLIFALVRYQLFTHHDRALEQAAAQVEAVLSQEGDSENLTPRQIARLDQIGGIVIAHRGAGGQAFYRSAAAQGVPLPSLQMMRTAGADRGVFDVLPGSPPLRLYTRPYRSRDGRRGVIRVAEPLGDVVAPLRSISVALLILAPLAIAGSAAAGYWLARNALSPVDSVTRLAREIEATNLERRLPPAEVEDELGRLVGTFNQMIERLEGAFEGMKRFTEDASHELRAPLSRMRGALDVALSRRRNSQDYRDVLLAIGDDVDHLRSITEDLLVLARADAGRIDLERERVHLDVVAAEAVEWFRPTAEARRVEMQMVSEGPVVVLGDEPWLRQLAANLLDNALVFAPLGSGPKGSAKITVRVSSTDRDAVLSVEDTGPGLPAVDLEHVFERFFRGANPNSRTTRDGAGLGLAIAAWITRSHHGTILAENLPGGGTRFVARFPLAGGPTAE